MRWLIAPTDAFVGAWIPGFLDARNNSPWVPVHVDFLASFEVMIGDAPLSQNATPASPWPGGHAEGEILGIVAVMPRHSFTDRLRSWYADHHDRRSRPVCPWPPRVFPTGMWAGPRRAADRRRGVGYRIRCLSCLHARPLRCPTHPAVPLPLSSCPCRRR